MNTFLDFTPGREIKKFAVARGLPHKKYTPLWEKPYLRIYFNDEEGLKIYESLLANDGKYLPVEATK